MKVNGVIVQVNKNFLNIEEDENFEVFIYLERTINNVFNGAAVVKINVRT